MHTKIWTSLLLLAATSFTSQAVLVWTVGIEDNAQPVNLVGGGANAAFVQEQGTINALPGSATNVATVPASQSADNDYYLAGTYTTAILGNVTKYGAYVPVGVVAANEGAAERAHAGGDLDLRYHFNLPTTLLSTHRLTITWNASSLHGNDAAAVPPVTNSRFGNELYFNGVLVAPQVIVFPADLGAGANPGTTYVSASFSAASVNALTGPGPDNIVSLKGISYNAAGGGNWMGLDYIRLDSQIPEPSSAIMVLFGAMGLVPFLRRRRA